MSIHLTHFYQWLDQSTSLHKELHKFCLSTLFTAWVTYVFNDTLNTLVSMALSINQFTNRINTYWFSTFAACRII